jgi:CBS domain containing-hemolysin-like protein
MPTDNDPLPTFILPLLSVFLLIVINAFFVTAEFAMVSVRRSRISQLVEAGDLQAQTVQSLQRSLDRLLSTTQLGITLSSLALGWIGERTMAVFVKFSLISWPIAPRLTDSLAHGIAIPLAFLLIAYLQIVLGELCPKAIALRHAEQLARLLGPPVGVIARIFNPFIWILNQSTYFLLRLIGLQVSERDWHNRVTSEELQLIIATEGESTGLEAKERLLLSNVFQFREITAVEVMVPRTSVIAIPETATFETVLNEVTTTDHSRYPVKGESLDDILGILDFKELALPLSRQDLKLSDPIEPWVKPVRFVPESMTLDELLALMQRSRLKMVVVVDEYGGTSGLITLQDLIAEIIGDDGESETNESPEFQMLDDQTFLVDAQMNLEELNEVLDIELPLTDEYQTLGGFLLYNWQKIPALEESLSFQNLEFTVVAAEGPRLSRIRIHRHDPEPASDLGLSTLDPSDRIEEQ